MAVRLLGSTDICGRFRMFRCFDSRRPNPAGWLSLTLVPLFPPRLFSRLLSLPPFLSMFLVLTLPCARFSPKFLASGYLCLSMRNLSAPFVAVTLTNLLVPPKGRPRCQKGGNGNYSLLRVTGGEGVTSHKHHSNAGACRMIFSCSGWFLFSPRADWCLPLEAARSQSPTAQLALPRDSLQFCGSAVTAVVTMAI